MSIAPLSSEVIAQIKSSNVITSLNEVIIELFKNSLDAHATKIELIIEYDRGACMVEDNGWGISPSEFYQTGGLCKAYHTSKLNNSENMHGGKGNFLSSLISLALITITSRHHLNRSHSTLSINHSVVILRQIPSAPQHHIQFDHGTRVTVHNLFGNMPVRLKQRALVAQRQGGYGKEWDGLLIGILRVFLAWETMSQITVTLRNKSTNKKVILQSPKSPGDRGVTIQKTCSLLRQASLISAEEAMQWITVEASTKNLKITGAISLRPCATKRCQFFSLGIKPIILEGCALYEEINRLFCNSNFGNVEEASEIGDAENKRRKSDKRYKGDGYTFKELKSGRKGVEKWPKFYLNIRSQNLLGTYNTYGVENFTWQNFGDDSDKIKELLQKMISKFLKDYNFCPREDRSGKLCKQSLLQLPNTKLLSHSESEKPVPEILSTSGSSTSLKRHRNIENQLGKTINLPSLRQSKSSPKLLTNSQSKVKFGTQTRSFSTFQLQSISKLSEQPDTERSSGVSLMYENTTGLPSNKTPTLTKNHVMLSSIPEASETPGILPQDIVKSQNKSFNPCNVTINGPNISPISTSKINVTQLEYNSTAPWISNQTKREFFVNEKPGFIPSPIKKWHDSLSQASSCQTNFSEVEPNLTTSWIDQLLQSWESPIYPRAEQSIRQVQKNCATIKTLGPCSQFYNCSELNIDTTFNTITSRAKGRISKHALKEARLIAQVDKKFLLVKVSTGHDHRFQGSDEILVMIDQHAADERIRIESLLDQLCSPANCKEQNSLDQIQSHTLIKPLIFCLSPREIELLSEYQDHFSNWGIKYTLPTESFASKETTQAQIPKPVTVQSLPQTIAERCQLQPHLLISLLRNEIWKLHETQSSQLPKYSLSAATRKSWIDRIHTCPSGLLDLLNARACRSAIMFNDELSREQAVNLVRRLSECSFPFQCAHGRPSMVPLVELATLEIGQDTTSDIEGCQFHQIESNTLTFGAQFRKWKRH